MCGRANPALLENNSAVLVEEGGQPVGLITRSDLLEFVAHSLQIRGETAKTPRAPRYAKS